MWVKKPAPLDIVEVSVIGSQANVLCLKVHSNAHNLLLCIIQDHQGRNHTCTCSSTLVLFDLYAQGNQFQGWGNPCAGYVISSSLNLVR